VGAIPHAVTAILFLRVFGGYVSGEIRITPEVREYTPWILYELLAVAYATILPLGMVVTGVLKAVGLSVVRSRRGEVLGTLLLVVPFALLAWSAAPRGSGGLLALCGFLLFAAGRWLPWVAGGHTSLVADGLSGFARCFLRGARIWGFVTLSFFLSAVFILPLEPLLGLEMPSVDHGQVFLILGMGVVYFLLNTVLDVLPVDRWFARRHPALGAWRALAEPEEGPSEAWVEEALREASREAAGPRPPARARPASRSRPR